MKICPRCGSRNIDWIIPQNWSIWEYKDFDYTEPIIKGDEKLAKEIKEEKNLIEKRIKKHKLEKEDEIEEDREDEEIERRLDELDL
ncbi:hypothetical protein ALNOE001_00520 [Candidatus Methanobinarius endosymbioticus]|uniref:Uncharacterized protein n=1 Tax=Candidatus Methanobinarius endosymbioticus TaxID=2006182 RepID=A0A366MEL9_9EURY|nr:hypothetical protein ALNOE001_00520 [Candidatus Methanobinarius endosymbioticus]